MIFKETALKGAYIIEIEPIEDERGFFARSFCAKEFEKHGLNFHIAQCNISYNERKGTLRGMHYQTAPYEEAKLVRCTMGEIYDVIIDIRPYSATYMRWISIELTAKTRKMLYIPEGFAHGFQTLADCTEVFYQMSEFYQANSAKGIRWNYPTFGIKWPIMPPIMNDKDRSYPDFIQEPQ
ncbi:dTDP-4-dehydrorhamnose 3,5-epimerase [bacterium]|nr:dTDP-4-dehydrorhamnose 3,5-epimerase [bacterium]